MPLIRAPRALGSLGALALLTGLLLPGHALADPGEAAPAPQAEALTLLFSAGVGGSLEPGG